MAAEQAAAQPEELEGLDAAGSWGDYPIDEMLIRTENRTVFDVIRRIDQGSYVLDPDFQRDFIWPEEKQSKLIESVIMRIPLPVFYLAEDEAGRMVAVDGLQRLSTFNRFLKDKLELRLADRKGLDRKRFRDLPSKLKNRVEDCNLTFYIIDSKAPERARLDIFERVNGGVPLTRQQMRNCLYMGGGTRFLREEASMPLFLKATGSSLKTLTMRDREFVNRFCAFQILPLKLYGDMDEFLARALQKMNAMSDEELDELRACFRRGLVNNYTLFGQYAFRKHKPEQVRRGVLNASLWDVMSTGLSHYSKRVVARHATRFRKSFYGLLRDEEFDMAISYGPNDPRKVRHRFVAAREMITEVLGAATH